MNSNKKNRNILPWLVWGLAAGFFFIEYIARVAPSVMATELAREFRVSAFALGSLSACFYYAYVPMQLPVGMLVDRFGIRRLLIIATLGVSAGCFIFSRAHSLYFADFSRFLIGFGSSFGFISAIKLASVWFPPRRFFYASRRWSSAGLPLR